MNRLVQFAMTTVIIFWPYMFFDNAPIWVGVMSFFVLLVNNICVAKVMGKKCVAAVAKSDADIKEYITKLENLAFDRVLTVDKD